jgi:plastocyanin
MLAGFIALCVALLPAAVAAPPPHDVAIVDFAFQPGDLAIRPGDVVVWTNQGATSHTVTFDSGPPDSGTLEPGHTYQATFNTIGVYSYVCRFHSNMQGVIRVDYRAFLPIVANNAGS